MSVRVLDVPELGYEAAIVRISGEEILMIDTELDDDERIDVMTRAMKQIEEQGDDYEYDD